MRAFFSGIILILTLTIQTTVMQHIKLWGVKANLVILVILSFAMIRGSIEGAIFGLLGGLLLDLISAKVFGMNALIGMYIGIMAGVFNKRFFKENYLVAFLFTILFTFLYELVFYLLKFYIWGENNLIYAIRHIIFPEVVFNCIIALPVYFYIIKIDRWLDGRAEPLRKY